MSEEKQITHTVLPRPIVESILVIGQEMEHAADPWWIIGSLAVALHGCDPGPINDLDLLVSERDGLALMSRWSCDNFADSGSAKFRSSVVLRPDIAPVIIDVMGGFKYFYGGNWITLMPQSRVEVVRDGIRLYIPDFNEMVDILDRFGRPKDLERASRMRRFNAV